MCLLISRPWMGRPAVGLARVIRSQCSDLGLEVREAGEVAVDAGEPQIGDLIEIAQRGQNRQTDFTTRYLSSPGSPEPLFDLLCEPGEGVFADAATLTRSPHTGDDLVTAERFGRA